MEKLIHSLFGVLICSLVITACTSNGNETIQVKKHVTGTEFSLKNEEWFGFIDSTSTILIKENPFVDSISIYYMKSNAPSVIRSSKYIVWKKDKLADEGEFNFRYSISNKQFFFGSFRKRGMSITEIDLNGNKFKKLEEIILDLNSDEKLSNPCFEIANATCKKSKGKLEVELQIHDGCLDKDFSHKVVYKAADGVTE